MVLLSHWFKKKKIFDPYLSPYMKINSKWIKDLNETSEENVKEMLQDFSLGKDTLDLTPKG
jgi:hypothetical protein